MTNPQAPEDFDLTDGWKQDDLASNRFFATMLEKHGASPAATHWGSRSSQEKRFSVLASIGDLAGARILDVGCGLADLHDWLKRQGITCDYTGVDLSPEMIAAASQRDPSLKLFAGIILEGVACLAKSYDYVLASGIFYRRSTEQMLFLEKMAERMFALCDRGVAFNSLSGWAAERDADEFYADPVISLAMARKITPWVTLRHDYHFADFTLYLRREAAES